MKVTTICDFRLKWAFSLYLYWSLCANCFNEKAKLCLYLWSIHTSSSIGTPGNQFFSQKVQKGIYLVPTYICPFRPESAYYLKCKFQLWVNFFKIIPQQNAFSSSKSKSSSNFNTGIWGCEKVITLVYIVNIIWRLSVAGPLHFANPAFF